MRYIQATNTYVLIEGYKSSTNGDRWLFLWYQTDEDSIMIAEGSVRGFQTPSRGVPKSAGAQPAT